MLMAVSQRVPPISTEQVAAFVALARMGSLHAAAQSVHLSDEGLRGRILALEEALKVDLYEKERGRRGDVILTAAGQIFLQRAGRFLDQACDLRTLFIAPKPVQEIQVLASHYLMAYVVVPVLREFRQRFPLHQLRLSTRAESQITPTLLTDPGLAIGICTPTEFPRGLDYVPWRRAHWCLAIPAKHRLCGFAKVSLANISDEPLIVFERGSAGRLHILESFHATGLEPNIQFEATSTPLMMQMVHAGLGIAIVSANSFTAVAHGLDVCRVDIVDPIRSIESGVFVRKEWKEDPAVRGLVELIQSTNSHSPRLP
jgi:DNA-binding transcriptional LysR family regulator